MPTPEVPLQELSGRCAAQMDVEESAVAILPLLGLSAPRKIALLGHASLREKFADGSMAGTTITACMAGFGDLVARGGSLLNRRLDAAFRDSVAKTNDHPATLWKLIIVINREN
jgi:hypothetical protein